MISTIRLNDTIYKDFTINSSAGQIKNADSLPTVAIYENSSTVALAYNPTVVNRSSGDYYVSADVTNVNGFSANNNYNFVVNAVVDSVTGKANILSLYVINKYADNVTGYAVASDISGQAAIGSLSALNDYTAAKTSDLSATTAFIYSSAITGGLNDYGAATCGYVSANSISSGAVLESLSAYGAATLTDLGTLATSAQLDNVNTQLLAANIIGFVNLLSANFSATYRDASGNITNPPNDLFIRSNDWELYPDGTLNAVNSQSLATLDTTGGFTVVDGWDDISRLAIYINGNTFDKCTIEVNLSNTILTWDIPANNWTGRKYLNFNGSITVWSSDLNVLNNSNIVNLSGDVYNTLSAYGAATCAYVSANSTSSGAILSALSAYEVATSGQVTQAQLSAAALIALNSYGAATCAYVSAYSSLSATILDALSAYTVAKTSDLNTITFPISSVTAGLDNYGAATCAYVSAYSSLSATIINALTDYTATKVSDLSTISANVAISSITAGLDNYGAATCAYVSANAGGTSSGTILSALSAYQVATSSQVTPAQLSAANMLAFNNYGAAKTIDLSATTAYIYLSAITGGLDSYGAATCAYVSANSNSLTTGDVLSALSAYTATKVSDLANISIPTSSITGALNVYGVALETTVCALPSTMSGYQSSALVSIDASAISAIAAIASASIAEYGDDRWSKIYGIPLTQWDIIVKQEDS